MTFVLVTFIYLLGAPGEPLVLATYLPDEPFATSADCMIRVRERLVAGFAKTYRYEMACAPAVGGEGRGRTWR